MMCDRPIIPKGTHPIENGLYVIPTYQIDSACNAANNLICNSIPGGIIYGPPRFGKTYCVKYLTHELKETYPVFAILCQRHKIPSEAEFYREILKGLNFAVLSGQHKNTWNNWSNSAGGIATRATPRSSCQRTAR